MNSDEYFTNKYKLLNKIADERVFYLEIDENKIRIRENCDEWFSIEVNKEELYELSRIFKDIADNYDEIVRGDTNE